VDRYIDDEPLSFKGSWIVAAFIGWALAYFWLSVSAAWPEDCRPSGRRGAGLVSEYLCSPRLLEGGATERALFVVLWGFPVALVVISVWFIPVRKGDVDEPA
jgi:hypothetical protein